jgi:hypothetical protein
MGSKWKPAGEMFGPYPDAVIPYYVAGPYEPLAGAIGRHAWTRVKTLPYQVVGAGS